MRFKMLCINLLVSRSGQSHFTLYKIRWVHLTSYPITFHKLDPIHSRFVRTDTVHFTSHISLFTKAGNEQHDHLLSGTFKSLSAG